MIASYCAVMPEGLKLSLDRKVSPRGSRQPGGVRAGRWVARIPNSFGLPAGTSCPGRTPFCDSCYAVNSERSSGVAEAMAWNLRLLVEAGTVEGMESLLMEMLAKYLGFAGRFGLSPAERLFRIHWDGDFFSIDYAQAWACVIRRHPDIAFWAYTRSFVPPVDVVPVLAEISNLKLFLSTDQWNLALAREQADKHGVLLAPCAENYVEAAALAPDRPSVICPENARRLPLMQDGVGACVRCRLCPDGRRDVLFSTSHK